MDVDAPRTPERPHTSGGMGAPPSGIGAKIKELRTAQGMSLQRLSSLSGVSTGMLSQLERNRANPSLRILTKIQIALGARASALFDDTAPAINSDPDFVRRKHQRAFCDLGYLTKQLLSPPSSQNLEIMILEIPGNASSGAQPLSYASEKAGLVLEGELILSVDGAETRLGEGDSFTFDGTAPHAFRNPTRRGAKVLWIISNLPTQRHL